MNTLLELECNLVELESLAKKLAEKTNFGDIYLLKGDLGVGKTTFARSFINSLFDKYNISRPQNIKSPSFPIMINYSLADYEINHYDLYRLVNKNELIEIGFIEDLEKNISIIEWPDLILNSFIINKYYLIQIEFINLNKRLIEIKHSVKKNFNV